MGKRGPKPEPTHLQLLKGTDAKHPERINQNEPQPRPTTPKRPSWLTHEAKRCWEKLAPICERMGTLTEADGEAFTALCIAWADMVDNFRIVKEWKRRARQNAREHGQMNMGAVSRTKSGYAQAIPQVAMMRAAMKEFRAWCGEFGLTPSARRGISIADDTSEDEMEALLSGG